MSLSRNPQPVVVGVVLDPLYLNGHELRFIVDAKPSKADFVRELKAALLTWARLAQESKNFKLKDEEEAWELAMAVKRHLAEDELEEFSVFELRELYPESSLMALADAYPELFGKSIFETEFFSARVCEFA